MTHTKLTWTVRFFSTADQTKCPSQPQTATNMFDYYDMMEEPNRVQCHGKIVSMDGRLVCICRKCGYRTRTMEAFKMHVNVEHGHRSYGNHSGASMQSYGSMEHRPQQRWAYKAEPMIPKMKLRRVPMSMDEKPYHDNSYRPKFKPMHNDNEDAYFEHNRKSEKNKMLACVRCPLKFDDILELNAHVQEHHPDKTKSNGEGVSCAVCDKSYASKRGLWTHIGRFHEAEYPFECQMCPIRFETKKELLYHIQLKHVTGKIMHCDHCDGQFVTAYQRAKHVKEVHSNAGKLNTSNKPYMEYTSDTESYLSLWGWQGVFAWSWNWMDKCLGISTWDTRRKTPVIWGKLWFIEYKAS